MPTLNMYTDNNKDITIYKTKTDWTKRRNRGIQHHSGVFLTHLPVTDRISKQSKK